MSWRTKVGRRLAWGYETASDGQWQRDGRTRRFMPTWEYRDGLLVAGLILFARWYWLGVVVRLHGGRGYGSSGGKGMKSFSLSERRIVREEGDKVVIEEVYRPDPNGLIVVFDELATELRPQAG